MSANYAHCANWIFNDTTYSNIYGGQMNTVNLEMNQRMKSLLSEAEINLDELFPLDVPELIELLSKGIHQHEDIYVLQSHQPTPEAIKRFSGPTGYEATENHIHMEDYIDRTSNPVELLRVGLSYTQALASRLEEQFPDTPFTIILSYSEREYPSCVVRFVRQREYDPWLDTNLDNYELEEILSLNVNVA